MCYQLNRHSCYRDDCIFLLHSCYRDVCEIMTTCFVDHGGEQANRDFARDAGASCTLRRHHRRGDHMVNTTCIYDGTVLYGEYVNHTTAC